MTKERPGEREAKPYSAEELRLVRKWHAIHAEKGDCVEAVQSTARWLATLDATLSARAGMEEPVAWAVMTAKGERWTIHTFKGEADAVAARWNEPRDKRRDDYGPLAPCTVAPLYAAPTRAREDALEEAARRGYHAGYLHGWDTRGDERKNPGEKGREAAIRDSWEGALSPADGGGRG